MSQWQQEISPQDQMVQLAERTARAVETIRTVVVLWAILTAVGLMFVVFLATKAANGS